MCSLLCAPALAATSVSRSATLFPHYTDVLKVCVRASMTLHSACQLCLTQLILTVFLAQELEGEGDASPLAGKLARRILRSLDATQDNPVVVAPDNIKSVLWEPCLSLIIGALGEAVAGE